MTDNKANIVDAKGTTQKQAREMLSELRHKQFSDDTDKLALALGRDIDEIDELLDGEDIIDDDLAMKIRGLAQQRGANIE